MQESPKAVSRPESVRRKLRRTKLVIDNQVPVDRAMTHACRQIGSGGPISLLFVCFGLALICGQVLEWPTLEPVALKTRVLFDEFNSPNLWGLSVNGALLAWLVVLSSKRFERLATPVCWSLHKATVVAAIIFGVLLGRALDAGSGIDNLNDVARFIALLTGTLLVCFGLLAFLHACARLVSKESQRTGFLHWWWMLDRRIRVGLPALAFVLIFAQGVAKAGMT